MATGPSKSALRANVNILFGDLPKTDEVDSTVVIAKKAYLKQHQYAWAEWLGVSVDATTMETMIQDTAASSSTTTLIHGKRFTVAALPDKVTRNNHEFSVHTVTDLVSSTTAKGQNVRLVFAGVANTNVGPLASAVAKAFSLYSQKTKADDDDQKDEDTRRTVNVSFLETNSSTVILAPAALQAASVVADGVQLAARLVDMTPAELTTEAYAAECKTLAESLEGVTMTEIVGKELDEKGYGGIYGVGKAATCPPRLVIMEYNPPETPTETVALVGKAIVYDTGGLSLKPKTGMCGMKADMGG